MTVSQSSPETLDHARGDALPSHQTEDPDAADATEGWLRVGGAAPGTLTLKHHLLSFRALWHRLLYHPVALWEGGGVQRDSY